MKLSAHAKMVQVGTAGSRSGLENEVVHALAVVHVEDNRVAHAEDCVGAQILRAGVEQMCGDVDQSVELECCDQ